MKKSLLIVLSLLYLSLNAQDFNDKIRLPVWTFHTTGTTIYGLSVGAFSHNENQRFVRTNGIRPELPGIGFLAPLGNGSPITRVYQIPSDKPKYSEILNGLNLSAGTWTNIKYNGLTIALVAQYGKKNNGLAAAGIWNAMDISNGMQISGLLNEALISRGLQISFSNKTLIMAGLQIGIVNRSSQTRGLQIGLWNVNE